MGLVCSITAQYFAAKASVGFAAKLRHALFAHIQTLSYTEMDTVGTSTLITRMTSDINQVQNGLNLALRLLLRSPFVVFGAMVMAFTIDCAGGAGVRGGHPPAGGGGVRRDAVDHAPVQAGPGRAGPGAAAPPGRTSPACG